MKTQVCHSALDVGPMVTWFDLGSKTHFSKEMKYSKMLLSVMQFMILVLVLTWATLLAVTGPDGPLTFTT